MKVAIVTGAASGIGKAVGEALAERGVCAVLADRQQEAVEQVASRLVASGRKASAHALDVREAEAFDELAQRVLREHGRVDYLFNNAGIGVGGLMEDYSPADWKDVFAVNLDGVAWGIQAVYPIMRAQRSGHIVNTASLAGLVASTNCGSYAATKHAVVGLSKSLRIEAAHHGVRVSVLCPGAIRTPILTGGKFGRVELLGQDARRVLELWEYARPMDPAVFADKALAAVDRNQGIIVIPGWWKAHWYLERLSPELSHRLQRFLFGLAKRKLAQGRSAAAAPSEPRGASALN